MQTFEVRLIDADGDVADSYLIECADIFEALPLQDEGREDAVLVRPVAPIPAL